ncbi:MAG: Gfo/Idh/MocA family oxidoreductase [Vampirovibrio sp.]|nr:Gfo/Idh/MocA family oxidoreductase [Vampirovibrio sp.]
MTASPLKLLIIGAGMIGAFFDTPESPQVLTHAHAFSALPGFELVGFVDPNGVKLESAVERWGGTGNSSVNCKGFQSIETAMAEVTPDVVCVASPDETHGDILRVLAQYPLKLVFAEKPLTTDLAEAEEIVRLYEERNIPLAVNYSRRYVPEFRVLQSRVREGELGRFVSGAGCYGKGLTHNGTHLLDLLHWFLGPFQQVQVLDSVTDFTPEDPSYSAVLWFDNQRPFHLSAVDSRLFTLFEMDLLFEKGRVRMNEAGFELEISEVQPDTRFTGYQTLHLTDKVNTGLDQALSHAAVSLEAHLLHQGTLACSGQNALTALAMAEEIRNHQKASTLVTPIA